MAMLLNSDASDRAQIDSLIGEYFLEEVTVMVCQCKCIERHMQSKRSVLEDDETRSRSVLSLSLLVIVIK